jgi:signal peptidase II
MMTQDAPQSTTVTRRATEEQPSLAKLGAGIAATVIALDQVTKLVIDTIIGPSASRSSYWFLGEWLGFDYVRNTGVAFGIKLGSSTLTLVVSSLAFLIVGLLFWRLAAKNQVAAIGAGLLAGGAIGNLIDRLRFDAVVDFVAVGPWPRFNIADSAITIGVLILAWSASGGHDEPEPDDEERAQHG